VAVTVALGAVALTVAELAVDLAVRGVAATHRVQGAVALHAIVARLMPHLAADGDGLSLVDSATAARAAVLAILGLDPGHVQSPCCVRIDGPDDGLIIFIQVDVLWNEDTAGTGGEAVALGAEALGIAELAVDITVRAVAEHHGVQGSAAVSAVVATLVPFDSTAGQSLLGGEHLSTAARTALLCRALDARRVDARERWVHVGQRLAALAARDVLSSKDTTTTGSEAVALRSVLLSVAELAVDLAVGGITASHGVERSVAVAAVVAALVELPVADVHLLSHEDSATAARAVVLVVSGRDLGRVHACRVRHSLDLVFAVAGNIVSRHDTTATSGKAVALRSVSLSVAQLAVDLAVRRVAASHGVQRTVAQAAVVAALVEGPAAGVDLLRGENLAAAARATLAASGLDLGHVDTGLRGLGFVDVLATGNIFSGKNTTSSSSEAVTFGSVLLSVAEFAVDLSVSAVTVCHGVQRPLALETLEALLMEPSVLGHHHLCAVDLAAASGASHLSLLRLDYRVGHAVGTYDGDSLGIFRC